MSQFRISSKKKLIIRYYLDSLVLYKYLKFFQQIINTKLNIYLYVRTIMYSISYRLFAKKILDNYRGSRNYDNIFELAFWIRF